MDAKKLKKQKEVAAKLSKPKPVLLPSGSWRCQIMVRGRRIDVIEGDPALAHAKALAIKEGLVEEDKPTLSMTVGEAIDKYIESKDAVLSPSTVAGYKRIRENTLQELMPIKLSDLTQERVQRAVNAMAKDKTPKTVRNAHGLLSAALSEYKPDMVLRTTLPQKKKYEVVVPSGDDIEKIMQTASGTEMELPILLALWLGLRMSEILGLTWDSVDGDALHVKSAIVDGEHGKPTEKGTKTYSGDRKIRLPNYIKELMENREKTGEHIIRISRRKIWEKFQKICEKAGVPHMRFHDLRHANASIMLSLGVPDKYAMERMGHATNNMLKTVYQHTLNEKQIEVADAVDDYFNQKLHMSLHTRKDEMA